MSITNSLLIFTGAVLFLLGTWENWAAYNRFCQCTVRRLQLASHLTWLSMRVVVASCHTVPSAVLVKIASSLFVSLADSRTHDKIERNVFCRFVFNPSADGPGER